MNLFPSFFRNTFSKNNSDFFKKLYIITEIKAKNKALYIAAFTHKSYQAKNKSENYERLEFIGDSVLNTIISELLYIKFPNGHEGTLTEMRSKMVNRKVLNKIGYKIGLHELLFSLEHHGKFYGHVLGNVLEALVGAIYLDKGYKRTHKFVCEKIVKPHLDMDELSEKVYSYKNLILNWAAQNKREIEFVDKAVEGPNKRGWYEVIIIDRHSEFELGKGLAASKKEASQLASENAYSYLQETGIV